MGHSGKWANAPRGFRLFAILCPVSALIVHRDLQKTDLSSLSEIGDQPVNGVHILNVDKGWHARDA